jgi:Zn-dependent protease
MKWSWNIGKIAGIDTRVHATFALLLGWVALSTWSSASSVFAVIGTLLFTLAVFGSVLLHELGHALTARRFGLGTRAITLWPIGGVAELEGSPRNPREELWIALAGPAVNVVLAAGFGAVAWMLGLAGGGVGLALLGQLVGALALANIALGVFNLIPAFPMDGGRVLRAWLELRRGRLAATELAVRIGKGFAVVFGLIGLASNFTLLLIAPFVWMAGDRELQAVRERARLERLMREAPVRRRAQAPLIIYWRPPPA